MNFLTAGKFSKPIGRFAGSAMGRNIARTIPGISAAVNILDVADVIAGDESLGNKIMDTGAMAIGGTAVHLWVVHLVHQLVQALVRLLAMAFKQSLAEVSLPKSVN